MIRIRNITINRSNQCKGLVGSRNSLPETLHSNMKFVYLHCTRETDMRSVCVCVCVCLHFSFTSLMPTVEYFHFNRLMTTGIEAHHLAPCDHQSSYAVSWRRWSAICDHAHIAYKHLSIPPISFVCYYITQHNIK